jgi:two-component system, NarL family, sensor kinase
MSTSVATKIGWGACAVSLISGAAAVVLILIHQSEPLDDWLDTSTQEVVVATLAFVGYSVFGALLVSRHPGNPIGWLFCLAGLGAGIGGLATEYAIEALVANPGSLPAGEAMAWLGSWPWILFVPVPATVGLLLFPTGQPVSPRWRVALWAAIGVNLALFFAFAFQKGELEGFGIDNPVGFLPEGFEAIGGLLLPVIALALASLIVRYRRAVGDERQQLRWMAAAAALFLVAIPLEIVLSTLTDAWAGWPTLAASAAIVLAAGVAVLKYRLYDLDLVVNRTLVYGLLTGLVVAGYVGLVAGLGELLDSTGVGVSLIATGVVAVAIQPLRSVIQRRVDRLMYGDRDDPYRALARLGERLGQAVDPDSVLPTIVDAVAEGLRLPYVAIELEEAGGQRIIASHGEFRGCEPVRLPLEYRGDEVGRLLAAPRPGSDSLGPADLALLSDLSRQAGVAAHAVRLTQDLRRSRERLVTTREEERRRLRRDLHDGLGPSLAGIALEIESARALVERDPSTARELLARLGSEVQESIADIRRIAYDLRPPTLDELGLVAAVREQAARLGSAGMGAVPGANGLRVAVETPAELPALPAAVEVAAYRIVLEALTNVSRHAGASSCTVRIAVEDGLELEVADDGGGINGRPGEGLGLTSMRERAEELGGSLSIGPGADGRGTVVRARIPAEPA